MPPLVLKSLDYRPRWSPWLPPVTVWTPVPPVQQRNNGEDIKTHQHLSYSLLILLAYVSWQPSGLWVGDAVVKESTGGLLTVHDAAGWFSSKAGKTPFLRKLEWKTRGLWRAQGGPACTGGLGTWPQWTKQQVWPEGGAVDTCLRARRWWALLAETASAAASILTGSSKTLIFCSLNVPAVALEGSEQNLQPVQRLMLISSCSSALLKQEDSFFFFTHCG